MSSVELMVAVASFLVIANSSSQVRLDESSVTFLGGIELDGIKFHFVKDCQKSLRGLEGGCAGWVKEYNNRHIWIVSGYDRQTTLKICEHEMFHIFGNREKFKGMSQRKFKSDHDLIGRSSDTLPNNITYPTCDRLVARLV